MLVAGHDVMDAPAGIGTGTDPTPPGQFFVAFFEQTLGPGYGPFILVTSAHSDAISDWENSGDAVIGIHGPLGADIGSAGATVSHGCIRLPVNDLVRLAGLPAGTPVAITAWQPIPNASGSCRYTPSAAAPRKGRRHSGEPLALLSALETRV